ncbi:dystroglycan-like [Dorcoceras hygrometricum]|uniref:Dystroglycan-like n=1 Tax=Dorcoceras hygrometricum TaxID=472368 RepID=A0A2Z7A132_9LAMI|nr:dystroglycan-like [Dorcoceras hygrometricum]
MASAYISNALQINFDSVLGIQENEGMVNMFKALETYGLREFLGCPSVLYEQELVQFFDTAIVQDGDITCAVSGKYVEIFESRFAGVFNLPTDGFTDLSEVPNHLVMQARTVFARIDTHVPYSCKKRLLKYEFRLLNDILAKSITVKAGSLTLSYMRDF